MKVLFFLIFFGALVGIESPTNIRALYHSLDPKSLPQHLAFYELYPESREGQLTLQESWQLLTGTSSKERVLPLALPSSLESIISLVNKRPNEKTYHLSAEELQLVESIGEHLPNRSLKGHNVTEEKQVLELTSQEVDVARGLLLTQELPFETIREYEAILDLMALQILTRLNLNDPPEKKITAINTFIFEEMGFRFPPHSLYAKDIDVYTFLPSVLDSRQGVCLGVSMLYLSLAQRLGLNLEAVTPPGHIYIRYRDNDKVINIETTARGIHVDSKEYLGIDTRSLQLRSLKDTIGLTHFNQASTYWQQELYEKALISYKKAAQYLPEDMLLKELMAYTHLFLGNQELGKKLLHDVKDHLPSHAINSQTVATDYLNGKIDREGIKPLFMPVDETRESILKKKEGLEKTLSHYPQFRAGLFSLATTWLQLHRLGEAVTYLEKYHDLDPSDATVEYYLAAIYTQRFHYNKAWDHLKLAEDIVKKREHEPLPLKELRKELSHLCPEKL